MVRIGRSEEIGRASEDVVWSRGGVNVIFAKADHIRQIIAGTKTQTRRPSGRYQVGRTYAVQPGRGKPAIPEGRILITGKRLEDRRISREDAKVEGGYTPDEFETLYESMYPDWVWRYAYTFKFIPAKESSGG